MAFNGGTLEDCTSNVFSMTDLAGLHWKCFVTPSNAPRGVPLPSDPVLNAYGKSVQAGLTCTWRRKQRHLNPGVEVLPIPNFTTDISKELWVFWYTDEPPEKLSEITEDLESQEECHLSNTGTSMPYEVRVLFFKAMHSRLELVMMKSGYFRFGRWFAKPITMPDHDRPMLLPDYIVAFQSNFFVSGTSNVCMTITTQRQPLLMKLSKLHLECDLRLELVVGPRSMRGTLLPRSVKPTDKILQGEERAWEEWRCYLPPCEMERERNPAEKDVKDDERNEKYEGIPRMVHIEIDGIRMLYPSCLLAVTWDEEVRARRGPPKPPTKPSGPPPNYMSRLKYRRAQPSLKRIKMPKLAHKQPDELYAGEGMWRNGLMAENVNAELQLEAVLEMAGARRISAGPNGAQAPPSGGFAKQPHVRQASFTLCDPARKGGKCRCGKCRFRIPKGFKGDSLLYPVESSPLVKNTLCQNPIFVGQRQTNPLLFAIKLNDKKNALDAYHQRFSRVRRHTTGMRRVSSLRKHLRRRAFAKNNRLSTRRRKARALRRNRPLKKKVKRRPIPKGKGKMKVRVKRSRSPPFRKQLALPSFQDAEDDVPVWAESSVNNLNTGIFCAIEDAMSHFKPSTSSDSDEDDDHRTFSPFTPVQVLSPCAPTCHFVSAPAGSIPEENFADNFRINSNSGCTVPITASQQERAKEYECHYDATLQGDIDYQTYHNRRHGEKRKSSYPLIHSAPRSPEQPGSQETIPATSSPPPELFDKRSSSSEDLRIKYQPHSQYDENLPYDMPVEGDCERLTVLQIDGVVPESDSEEEIETAKTMTFENLQFDDSTMGQETRPEIAEQLKAGKKVTFEASAESGQSKKQKIQWPKLADFDFAAVSVKSKEDVRHRVPWSVGKVSPPREKEQVFNRNFVPRKMMQRRGVGLGPSGVNQNMPWSRGTDGNEGPSNYMSGDTGKNSGQLHMDTSQSYPGSMRSNAIGPVTGQSPMMNPMTSQMNTDQQTMMMPATAPLNGHGTTLLPGRPPPAGSGMFSIPVSNQMETDSIEILSPPASNETEAHGMFLRGGPPSVEDQNFPTPPSIVSEAQQFSPAPIPIMTSTEAPMMTDYSLSKEKSGMRDDSMNKTLSITSAGKVMKKNDMKAEMQFLWYCDQLEEFREFIKPATWRMHIRRARQLGIPLLNVPSNSKILDLAEEQNELPVWGHQRKFMLPTNGRFQGDPNIDMKKRYTKEKAPPDYQKLRKHHEELDKNKDANNARTFPRPVYYTLPTGVRTEFRNVAKQTMTFQLSRDAQASLRQSAARIQNNMMQFHPAMSRQNSMIGGRMGMGMGAGNQMGGAYNPAGPQMHPSQYGMGPPMGGIMPPGPGPMGPPGAMSHSGAMGLGGSMSHMGPSMNAMGQVPMGGQTSMGYGAGAGAGYMGQPPQYQYQPMQQLNNFVNLHGGPGGPAGMGMGVPPMSTGPGLGTGGMGGPVQGSMGPPMHGMQNMYAGQQQQQQMIPGGGYNQAGHSMQGYGVMGGQMGHQTSTGMPGPPAHNYMGGPMSAQMQGQQAASPYGPGGMMPPPMQRQLSAPMLQQQHATMMSQMGRPGMPHQMPNMSAMPAALRQPDRKVIHAPPAPAEGSSVVMSIVLQDSILDLHYDTMFDSCPVCSCIGNIKSRELGVYITPPEVLRGPTDRQEREINAYSGFFVARGNNHIQCTCGFSAVRHRYLSLFSGLFWEDSREATGIHASVALVAPPLKDENKRLVSKYLWFDGGESMDRWMLNALRIQCLAGAVCRTVNYVTAFEERVDRALMGQSVGQIIGSHAQYLISQVDSVELLLLGNSAVELSLVSGTRPRRQMTSRSRTDNVYQFFHPWGLQTANELLDTDDREWKSLLDEIQPMFEDAVKTIRSTESNMLEGPLQWKTFAQRAGKNNDGSQYVEPVPYLLVGHDKDPIRIAPTALHQWEEMSLGPIDQPKDVMYLVMCPHGDSERDRIGQFMTQLSNQYESMRLGRHIPWPTVGQRDGICDLLGPKPHCHNTYSQAAVGAAVTKFLSNLATHIDDAQFVARLRSWAIEMEKCLLTYFQDDKMFEREAYRTQLAVEFKYKRNQATLQTDAVDKKQLSEFDQGQHAHVSGQPLGPTDSSGQMLLGSSLGQMSGASTSNGPHTGLVHSGGGMPMHGDPGTMMPPPGQAMNTQQQPAQSTGNMELQSREIIERDLEPEEIPYDEKGTLPQIIVIYVIDSFLWGSEARTSVKARAALQVLLRSFESVRQRMTPKRRGQIQLQIVGIEQIYASMGRLPDAMNTGRWHGDVFEPVRSERELVEGYPAPVAMRELCLTVYRAPRVLLPECISSVKSRCMTKFGPGSELIDTVDDMTARTQNAPMHYQVSVSPVQLLPTPMCSDVKGDHANHVAPLDVTLYVTYCLVADEFLVAAMTDSLGKLNENLIVNLRPHKEHEGKSIRLQKHTSIIDGLMRLWDSICDLVGRETKHMRVVVGKLGKVGHGEFRTWNQLVTNAKTGKHFKPCVSNCAACSQMPTNSKDVPGLQSICLVSTEPEPFMRIYPDLVNGEIAGSGSKRNNRDRANAVHTPDDVSCTHIVVFPVTPYIDLTSAASEDTADDKDDFDFGGLDFDDDMVDDGLNINEIIETENEQPAPVSASLSSGPSFFCPSGQDQLQNQPLAVGFLVSTAPVGDLPDWFWASCPSAKRRAPVHLRSSLHIKWNFDSEDANDFGEVKKKEKKTDALHPLDHNETDVVLRHVLETYNALSWLVIDPVTGERASCLPIHMQSLMRLYHSVVRTVM